MSDKPLQATGDTARVEAISDGILAVAMTLLVLGIRIPESVPLPALPRALFNLWPQLLAFMVSFLISAFYWVAHHLLFELIERADRGLLWLNAMFLMLMVLVPFSTQILSMYAQAQISVIIYSANLMAVGITLSVLWAYASGGHRLIAPDLPASWIRLASKRLLVMPLVCLVTIGLSFASVTLSIAVLVAGPILYSLPSPYTPYYAARP